MGRFAILFGAIPPRVLATLLIKRRVHEAARIDLIDARNEPSVTRHPL